MRTGDLVEFRGSGLLSWFIRFWTHSAYAHCGVLWMCNDVPMVFECRYFGGASLHALANRINDKPLVLASDGVLDLPLALAHLGDWYSVKNAVEAGLGEHENHAGWTCATFAAMIKHIGFHEPWTPQSLGEAVTSNKK